MADASHSEDTLFIVAEPDFAFYKGDADARLALFNAWSNTTCEQSLYELIDSIDDDDALKSCLKTEYDIYLQHKALNPLRLWNPSCEVRTLGAKAKAAPSCPRHEQTVQAGRGKRKAEASETLAEKIAPELLDLLYYAREASRAGRGGIIWAGWNSAHWIKGESRRKQSPRTGAQLVMVTAKAARKLVHLVPKTPNMHMGTYLRSFIGVDRQEELEACYIWPPIGGFVTHDSTTTPGKILENHFGQAYTQEGTRPLTAAHKRRKLGLFTPRGEAIWLTKELDATSDAFDAFWVTQRHPNIPETFAGRFHPELMSKYGWSMEVWEFITF